MKKFTVIICLMISGFATMAQTIELWAGTRWGFAGVGEGVIYKVEGNGRCPQWVYSFDSAQNGYSGGYGGLVAASNGLLYGTTVDGGLNNLGVIFEFDPVTNVYSKKWDFDDSTGTFAFGNLLQASNGKLYGVCYNGGQYNKGVLFEYDIVLDTCIALVQFDGINKGANPTGFVVQGSNGKLYGVTYNGGLSNYGTIFEFDLTTSTLLKLYDFDGVNNTKYPVSIMQASNGKLYGMSNAFTGNFIFNYDINTSLFTRLLNLTDSTGNGVDGGLVEAPNGKLYGVGRYGGDTAISGGAIFEFDTTSNTITRVVSGPARSGYTYYMGGTLMVASNGKLYGTSDFDYYEYDYINDIYFSAYDLDSAFSGSEPRYMRFVEIVNNNAEYVWPGDCNKDLVANNTDLLSIGLAYNDSGAIRPCASIDWISQANDNWTASIAGGVNAHHADCNGDGYVNADDTTAIAINYGLNHPLRQASSQTGTYDIYLVQDLPNPVAGDTIRYSIYVGGVSPVDSLYGIAYSFAFDSALAGSMQSTISYAGSTLGSNLLSIERDFHSGGYVDAAVTRTDRQDTLSVSLLGTFSFIVSTTATAQNLPLIITPFNVVAVTAGGDSVTFNAIADTIPVNNTTGLNEISATNYISLYPNPANSTVTVITHQEILQIEITDVSGRTVYNSAPGNKQCFVNISSLGQGVYSISVATTKEILRRKLIVQRD